MPCAGGGTAHTAAGGEPEMLAGRAAYAVPSPYFTFKKAYKKAKKAFDNKKTLWYD